MTDDPDNDDSGRRTRALAGLAIVLALAVGAVFLVNHLAQESKIEDCLLAHRSNCDTLVPDR